MKRYPIILSAYCHNLSSSNLRPSSRRAHLSSVRSSSSFEPTGSRSFPDYSPKKPTIKDSEFVHRISTVIKQRCNETFRRILKPFESKFRPDHLIWVLMEVKNDYNLVVNLFEWSGIRRYPSLEARCIFIQIAASSKDLKMAQKLFHEFWTKPNVHGNTSVSQFLEKLIYTYKDWGSNPYVFDLFFQALTENGHLDDAQKLFDKMLNYGVILSLDSCNLLLSRLSRVIDGPKKLLKLFHEFSEVGVHWNTVSYNIILHALCQLGNTREAHSLLLQMDLRGWSPDAVSYSTVINGYCNQGELQSVLKVVENMKQKGPSPNAFTFNSIIILLCKTGKLADAENVLREMISQGIFPDNVVYTTLVDGFSKMGNVSSACRMYDEMQSRNIVPDFITYTALICAFCQSRKVEEADRLFHEMLNIGLKADEFTYTMLIDGYCKAGEIKRAFSLHNEMIQMRLLPNVVTDTALVDGLCKQGKSIQQANFLRRCVIKDLFSTSTHAMHFSTVFVNPEI
ncbi:hypothetical protein OROHE_002741 [Orobanche hederae]